jgi:DNA-binding transcriptional MerR regulator
MQGYSIGKVSKIVDLPQSVLRYWETVFDVFDPYKSEGGTRRYSQSDIDIILEIKELLYKRKFTIAGAQHALANRDHQTPAATEVNSDLIEIANEIDEIIEELSKEI